jgi:hypothetical protein
MAYGGELRWNGVQKKRDVINKDVNPDTENIKIALNDGWVITSTRNYKSFKPVRKGTAHIIHRL